MQKYNIRIDNINISYLDNNLAGKEILFFSHGWGADKTNLAAIFNSLISDFRIISIDLPGFGESDHPKETIGSIEYAEIIYKFLSKLDIKKIVYIGHSFGGKIGIVLSKNYPDIVKKLVLINSAGIRARRSLFWYLKVYSFKMMKFVYKNIIRDKVKLEKLKTQFGSDDYKNAGKMKDILVKTVSEDFTDYLREINCPTFLYWGEKDDATPIWMAKKMKKLIKDSGIFIVKNGGHFSFIDDSRIIQIIKVFAGA